MRYRPDSKAISWDQPRERLPKTRAAYRHHTAIAACEVQRHPGFFGLCRIARAPVLLINFVVLWLSNPGDGELIAAPLPDFNLKMALMGGMVCHRARIPFDTVVSEAQMSRSMSNRRGFLRSVAALAAGGACGSLVSQAQAVTARPQSDYGAVLQSACGQQASDHARLVEETEEALGLPATDPRLQAVLRRMTCPLCGCPVLPALPSGPQSPF